MGTLNRNVRIIKIKKHVIKGNKGKPAKVLTCKLPWVKVQIIK